MKTRSAVILLAITALATIASACGSQPVIEASSSAPSAIPTEAEVQATPSPTPTEETPSGILAVAFSDSAGLYQSITLTLIDPQTGLSQAWREFNSTGDVRLAFSGGSTAFRARTFFTPDYDRATTETPDPSDGSKHVGWITSDGEYVDVTNLITSSQSDFADAPMHGNPKFGADGMFYFTDENAAEIKRVDPDNLDAAAVEPVTLKTGVAGSGEDFDVYPDGSVCGFEAGYYSMRVENTDPRYFGVRCVEDWLDSRTMLTTDDSDWMHSSRICTSRGFTKESQLGPVGSFFGSGSTIDRKDILPDSSTRLNWNPIASPDGEQVAFLSLRIDAGADLPHLFIVPRNGGDPASVETDYSFFRYGVTDDGSGLDHTGLQLLDWL